MYFHDSTLPQARNQDFEGTAKLSDVTGVDGFCRSSLLLAQFDYAAEDAAVAAHYIPLDNIVR
jgi:hypothetical protein